MEENQKISIAWKNLNYEVLEFSNWTWKRKVILKQLNGYFEKNSLNGLMGPSGAGKTTLLNCLSGIAKNGLTNDSEIYLSSANQSMVFYYIEQHVHEIIVGEMVVKDILWYAFKFKNGSKYSEEDINKQVDATLKQLLLDSTILNQPFQKCSGGEQKRIAIAQELMSLVKPRFLFIDEPVTGLDSSAAFEVIQCLQMLAKSSDMTIIASIHAPSNQILALFDHLYVLAKGGVCIYSGVPSEIKIYLETETTVAIEENQPPVETLIRLACEGVHNQTVDQLAHKTSTIQLEKISPNLLNLTKLPLGLPNPRKSFNLIDLAHQTARQFRITFIAKRQSFLQTNLLFMINFALISTIFSSKMSSARDCIPLAALNSTCSASLEEITLINENVTFFVYTWLYSGIVTICMATAFFASIAKVFRNEHRNYWYSLGVFYWSSTLVIFLELFFYSLFIAGLSYFLTSQHATDNYQINPKRIGHYALFIMLLCFYMQAIGQLVSIFLLEHFELALICSLVLFNGSTLINGFFVDTDTPGSDALTLGTDLAAFKFIGRGILYSIYGLYRCDWQQEFSFILFHVHADVHSVHWYVLRVLINIILLRVVIFVAMYFKFNHNQSMDSLVRWIKSTIAKHDDNCNEINYQGTQTDIQIELPKSKQDNTNNLSKNNIAIAWRNLSLLNAKWFYEITPTDHEEKNVILRNLNGQFEFGTLNAVMGISGAGKTSLLKVLNGRCKTRLSEATQFYLSKHIKISSCFITQEVSGHLMTGLTAKQMLVYASRLKNLKENVDHEKIALGLLSELDLIETANTKVDRCSGGERKRLALALELTSQVMPNLVCIDEPTSGLDSNSAEVVISCLKMLAHSHSICIVASIHQPNSRILHKFDQLYVLARGGVCIYSGSPMQIQSYLTTVSEINHKSSYPIETIIEYSCYDRQNSTVQCMIQQTNAQLIDVETQLHQQTQVSLEGITSKRVRFSLYSVYILLLRFVTYFLNHYWKQWLFFSVNYILYGLMLPLFYDHQMVFVTGCFNLDDDWNSTQCAAQSVDERNFLLNNFRYNYYYSIFFMVFLLIQFSLALYFELPLFTNEHRNGWYSTGSFYVTKTLVEILPLLPTILLYVYICNLLEEIRPGIYWNIVLILIFSAIAFQGLSHIIMLIPCSSFQVAQIIGVSIFIFSTLLSNFFLFYPRLHYIYQFLSNFAIARFTFEALVLLQYGFGRCGDRQISSVLYMMSISDEHYLNCIAMLLFNALLYHSIALYMLTCKVNPVQNRRQRAARIVQYRNSLNLNLNYTNFYFKKACL